MALFRSDKKTLILRIKKQDWRTREQRDEILQSFIEEDLKLGDVAWMVLERDRAVRALGAQLLLERRFPNTFEELMRLLATAGDAPRGTLVQTMAEFATPSDIARLGAMIRVDEDDKETNKEGAATAIEVLLAFPVDRTLDQLQRLLRHSDREVRNRTLRRILESPPPQLEGTLRTALLALAADPEERIRASLVRALEPYADDEIIDLLVERMRADEAYTVHRAAAQVLEALADRGDRRLLERLIPLLSEGDDRVRDAAFRICFKLGNPTELIRRIILFSKSLMGWMRERIHQTIGRFGESVVDPIIQLMYHEDEDIRNSALIFATHFRTPKLVEPLMRLVNDTNWWTRVIAIETLGQFKDERAVDVLLQALNDEEVRWSTIEALANTGSRRALAPIARLLRDSVPDVRREVIRALEVYNDPRALPLLERCFKSDPELAVREHALNAYRNIAKKNQIEVDEGALKRGLQAGAKGTSDMERLLLEARRIGASDLHVSVGSPLVVRVGGQLTDLIPGSAALNADQVLKLVVSVLSEDQRKVFQADRQIDLCHEIPDGGRYRLNAYYERRGLGAVFRVIPTTIPDFEYTGLPLFLTDITNYNQGLIIVSGMSGSGKTTTLAALVNLVNERRRGHIIILENPIEYVHAYRRCLVNQRQVGRDTASYPSALRAALRQNPDVIVVGDMSDVDTIRLALDAAETGHLVIATMNTTSAPKTLTRLIDLFPAREQSQMRVMVAESLKLVICQALLPGIRGGLVPAHEILVMNSAIARAIRDQREALIPSLVQMGRNMGMQMMDEALMELFRAGRISAEDAYLRADKKETFEELVTEAFLESIYE